MVGLSYWLPFVFLATYRAVRAPTLKVDKCIVGLAGVVLVLLVGFRYQVGGDWEVYLSWVGEAREASLARGLEHSDAGYALLNWLGANWFGGIYFVNTICAVLAVGSLVYFCNRLPDPILALSIAVPYLVTVVYMGYTRQSVAIGLSLVALNAALEQKPWRYLFWVMLAALFHQTALFMLIFLPAVGRIKITWANRVAAAIIAASVAALGYFLFEERIIFLLQRYISEGQGLAVAAEDGYHSSGAIARLLMSVGAAGAFVALLVKGHCTPIEQRVWGSAAIAVIVLFLLSFFLSTLADRLGLYLIALQIYAFSSLPNLFVARNQIAARLGILTLYGISLWVWLNFGTHSESWLPYQSALSFLL